MTKNISTIILTYNEELHIERSIKSAKKISNEIFIVDSFSNDKTLKICKKYDVKIFQHKFINQAKQFNWALKNLPIKNQWVMKLDADEYFENSLIDEIKNKLPKLSKKIVGINIKRKHIFMGKWIKFGGRYPLTLLRIWRNGHGKVEDRWVDEHVIIKGGSTTVFKNNFIDNNMNNLDFFINKHNNYATREAIEILTKKYDLNKNLDNLNIKNNFSQSTFKRFLKEFIYNKITFTISSLFYFLYRYIILLGFLDGKEGLIYHFLQGYWYRFLVGAKVTEIEKQISKTSSKKKIINKISNITGFKLDHY